MLRPIASGQVPGSNDGYVIRPELVEYTARIWQIGTTRETFPMLKFDARLSPNSVENRDLAAGLASFEAPLRRFAIYLEHNRARDGMPDWSAGTLVIDSKSASLFLYGLLDQRVGPVIGALMGAPTGRIDISINVIPTRVEPAHLRFEVTDYDLGVKSRIT